MLHAPLAAARRAAQSVASPAMKKHMPACRLQEGATGRHIVPARSPFSLETDMEIPPPPVPIEDRSRRRFLHLSTLAGAGILLPASVRAQESPGNQAEAKIAQQTGAPPVNATEGLMREHGILRRALLVYRFCAKRLHTGNTKGLAQPLNDTAQLFRRYGEDFHELAIEEQYISPLVMKHSPPVSRYPAVLTEQHRRGRSITDYIASVTHGGSIPSGSVKPLADALDALELMYEEHAAREDTIVYIAWKNALSAQAFDEMTAKFDEISDRRIGRDGFTAAEVKIGKIEEAVGAANLSQFTAPLVRVG